MSNFPQLKKRMMGLDMNQVQHFLLEMKEAHRMKVERIQEEIKRFEAENEDLAVEIKSLISLRESEGNKLEGDALTYAKQSAELLIKNRKDELHHLREAFDEKVGSLRKQISKSKEAIDFSKMSIRVLADELAKICRNLDWIPEVKEEESLYLPEFTLKSNHYFSNERNWVAATKENKEQTFWGNIHEYLALPNVESLLEELPHESRIHQEEVTNNGQINTKMDPSQEIRTSLLKEPFLDIEQIRQQFIIGRRSGQDIKSLEGEVIIKKGEMITSDILEHAVEAGRLAELIVHMEPVSEDDSS